MQNSSNVNEAPSKFDFSFFRSNCSFLPDVILLPTSITFTFQNLVIRFLKKAASNLQQPFKVVVPSHKLPLHDRQVGCTLLRYNFFGRHKGGERLILYYNYDIMGAVLEQKTVGKHQFCEGTRFLFLQTKMASQHITCGCKGNDSIVPSICNAQIPSFARSDLRISNT